MANYCNNQIEICFDSSEDKERFVTHFLKALKVSNLEDVKKVDLLTTLAPLEPSSNYYDQWGTRWFTIKSVTETDYSVNIDGDSAWVAPTAFFEKFIALFEEIASISIAFIEFGNDFCGEDYIERDIDSREIHTTHFQQDIPKTHKDCNALSYEYPALEKFMYWTTIYIEENQDNG